MPEITATPGQETAPDFKQLRAQILAEEQKRSAAIRQRVAAAGLTVSFAEQHIADGSSLDMVTDAIFGELAKRTEGGTRPHQAARVVVDERDTFRAALSNALAYRTNPSNELSEAGREYAGLSMIEMARECLGKVGGAVRRASRTEIPEAACNTVRLAGQHGNSDFPLILANAANKSLIGAFTYANPSYLGWTRGTTAPDFKTISRLRLGEAPILQAVPEGAEITFGAMTEARETYALATYARRVAITRQAIVNDDLGAFQQILPDIGVQVARGMYCPFR